MLRYWNHNLKKGLNNIIQGMVLVWLPVIFSTIDWDWYCFMSPLVVTAMRMHWYDPISSGNLTAVLDISKRRYDVMVLLIDPLTVTPVLFSNALSCQAILNFVTDTTERSDLFSWMFVMAMRLVPLTTQLISTPDFPNSTNKGSTSIDMEASTKVQNKRFSK